MHRPGEVASTAMARYLSIPARLVVRHPCRAVLAFVVEASAWLVDCEVLPVSHRSPAWGGMSHDRRTFERWRRRPSAAGWPASCSSWHRWAFRASSGERIAAVRKHPVGCCGASVAALPCGHGIVAVKGQLRLEIRHFWGGRQHTCVCETY